MVNIDATINSGWFTDQGGGEDVFQELPGQTLDKHALWQQII
jgi:hypothetical protein